MAHCGLVTPYKILVNAALGDDLLSDVISSIGSHAINFLGNSHVKRKDYAHGKGE